MTTKIVNKKSTLLGEDTTSCDLTGNLTKCLGSTDGSTGGIVILSALLSGEVLIVNIIVTPVSPVNLIILRFSQFATQDSDIQIREGATVIATVNGGGTGVRNINTSIEDVGVSTHTYSCYTQPGILQYQYAQGGGGTVVYGAAVNLTDTHAADGGGENTQRTTNENTLG